MTPAKSQALKPVRLAPGLFAVGAALFVEPLALLVVSDLQLGREEELRSAGQLVIDQELRSMKRRLLRVLKVTDASRVLFNGDLKHEFARISRQEWNHVLDLFDFLKEKGVEVIIVKGNHDNMLEPIVKKKEYKLLDYYSEKEYFFCHGHELPENKEFQEAKTIIIGHEHPALRVNDGVRHETAKCFLVGPWTRKGFGRVKKQLVVLPSYSELTTGSDILNGKGLGPFLREKEKEKLAAFVLVEDAVLRFGTVTDIRTAVE